MVQVLNYSSSTYIASMESQHWRLGEAQPQGARVHLLLVQLSGKFWNLKQASERNVFAVRYGAFASLTDALRWGLCWHAIVAPCRLPQLMQSYLYHQTKFVLELLAVILEHRILKSCIFLFTFAHIQWIFWRFIIFWGFTTILVCEGSMYFSWKEKRDLSFHHWFSFCSCLPYRQSSPCSISEVLFQGDI